MKLSNVRLAIGEIVKSFINKETIFLAILPLISALAVAYYFLTAIGLNQSGIMVAFICSFPAYGLAGLIGIVITHKKDKNQNSGAIE